MKSDGRVRGVRADTFVGVSVRPPLILVAVDDRAETRAVPDEGRRMGIRLANARSVRNPISPWRILEVLRRPDPRLTSAPRC